MPFLAINTNNIQATIAVKIADRQAQFITVICDVAEDGGPEFTIAKTGDECYRSHIGVIGVMAEIQGKIQMTIAVEITEG